MKRLASIGVTLLLAASAIVPLAHAQDQKTVVLGFSQEPDGFVMTEGGLYVEQVAQNLIYANLVFYDDKMVPFADLATEVPTVENGDAVFVGDGPDKHLETTMKLREDAVWQDGVPITADDVVFSWKLALNPVWGAGAGNDLESKYSDVVALDDHTVVFKMLSENQAHAQDAKNHTSDFADQHGPVIQPLYYFGLFDINVYPAHALSSLVDDDPMNSTKVKDLDKSAFSRAPLASGPYTLDSWDAGVQMTFHARNDYYRGRPPIDTIVIRGFEASKETLLAQIQAGDIQTIGSETLDVSDVDAVNSIPGVQAFVRSGTTIEHIDLNLDNPKLADKTVRQAMAYALDRQELVNRVLSGKSAIANSLVPPISPFFNPDTPQYVHNLDLAKQMLQDDGWVPGPDGVRVKNGQRLSFKYQSTQAGIRKKTMPLVKDQLARAGIEVNIEQIPAQTYFGASGPLRKGTLEMAEYADVGSLDAGIDMITKWESRFVPTEANNESGQNFARYKNPVVDSLDAKQASSLVFDERKGLIDAIQLIVADDLPIIPLYYRPNVTAASNHLVNYKPEFASNGYTWNVWEWDLQ